IETETAKRIEARRDRAATRRTMALGSGVSGMAAGACQVAGGVSSMNQAAQIQTTGERTTAGVNQETGALCLETDLCSQQAASDQLASPRASAIGQLASGTSGCLQSGGGLIAGLLQASADDFEADAQEHAARADRAQR